MEKIHFVFFYYIIHMSNEKKKADFFSGIVLTTCEIVIEHEN